MVTGICEGNGGLGHGGRGMQDVGELTTREEQNESKGNCLE